MATSALNTTRRKGSIDILTTEDGQTPQYLVNGENVVSILGSDEIEIFQASDIDDLATAGVITITGSLTMTMKTSAVTSSTRFEFVGFGTLVIKGDTYGGISTYTYSGTGTFVSGPGSFFINSSLSLTSASTGTLMTITTGFVVLAAALVFNWDDLGTVTNALGLSIENTIIGGWGAPFIATNVAAINLDSAGSLAWPTGLNLVETSNPDQTMTSIAVGNLSGSVEATAAVIRIDPDLPESTSVVFLGNAQTGGALFDIAGGSTGAFTAVADAAVASTTINSVTNSSFIARFNFTVGPTLFVGQEVVITGFVTNTAYNVTGVITTAGAGFFEISRIFFGSDETGSFTSASVTITDATHGLSELQSFTLDTDDATDYDGGATIYNALTNTFQVNRTFTATQTGTWDTSGLDQSDRRVLAKTNPAIVDSVNIGCAFVNDNSTVVGAIVNNTFTDIVFGTGGSALVECSNTERWKLIDELNGTFEYTGKEPFDGMIDYNFSVVSSGGAVEFRFKWQKDTGSGFANLGDDVEALADVASVASSITKTQPLTANAGDKIKPLITRNSGTSGITIRYATINTSQ